MRYLTAGESHGEKLVVIVEGVPSGIGLSEKEINFELKRRSKGPGRSSRQSEESNLAKIVSGVSASKTTGNPVCVEIENSFSDAEVNHYVMRPGHADLPGVLKHNFDDAQHVSERASARETAARLVAGVIAKNMLAEFGVEVYGYVDQIGNVAMKEDLTNMNLPEMSAIAMSEVSCPDAKASAAMLKLIDRAEKAGDTLGGGVKLVAVGLLAGLGGYSQGDSRLDSKIAGAVASVPSVKEVSIGSASFMSQNFGSDVSDFMHKGEGSIVRESNFSGGLEGGMTNGMPLIVGAKVRPVPTLHKQHQTVDLENGAEISWQSDRRSDVCVVPSVAVICETELALCLANAYLDKFGHDAMCDIMPAVEAYKTRVKERLS